MPVVTSGDVCKKLPSTANQHLPHRGLGSLGSTQGVTTGLVHIKVVSTSSKDRLGTLVQAKDFQSHSSLI